MKKMNRHFKKFLTASTLPQAGFELPSADDTSNEADTLPTKPPRLVRFIIFAIVQIFSTKKLSEALFYSFLITAVDNDKLVMSPQHHYVALFN